MSKQSAGSASRVRFAGFQKHLIVALCGVAVAALFPHHSSAQAINYFDFDTPEADPSQTLTNSCALGTDPAASGVLFCFNYATSPDSDGLSFISDTYLSSINPGASSSTDYALRLTEATGSQASSMWFSIPQDVADGFTAWYAVKLTPSNDSTTADGLAFVIQNAAGGKTDSIADCSETGSGFTVLGEGGGGCIGYGGIDNSVALEMDTYANSWDPTQDYFGSGSRDNHIALQSCGIDSNGDPIANSPAHTTIPNCLIKLSNGSSTLITSPIASAVPPATGSAVTLADGNPHQVVIVYNGPNDSPANTINVYLDPAFVTGTHTPVAGSAPLFSGPFDIAKYIKLSSGGPPYSPAYVGFTAATGASFEQHELMGFSFTPHVAHQNLGNVNVCPSGQTTPAPCSSTLTVPISLTADTNIGSVQVVTQGATGLDFKLGSGSTCTGAIAAGNSCTVNVTFAPLAPGLRMGAVRLFDNSGNLLATTPIYGTGQGPAIAFGPGMQTAVPTSGLSGSTQGVAVDASGNVYIADDRNNHVVKVTPSGAQTTVTATGLNGPYGVAVDGAGDVFIANVLADSVVEVTRLGVQTTVNTPNFTLNQPSGVAVDGAGDLFIADTGNDRVVEVPANGGNPAAVGTGLSSPVGLAVDAAGDLFIADTGNHRVVKVANGAQTPVNTTLSNPSGLAVDAAGDLFIADWSGNTVAEVTPGGVQTTVSSTPGGAQPYAVALDGASDVFIANSNVSSPNQVIEIERMVPPSLSFASTTVGGTSSNSPQSVTIQNIGNQALDAVSPGLTVNGPNFVQVAGPGTFSDCSATFALTPGEACNLSISFEPQSAGNPLTSTAVLSDNSLNAALATQSVSLSGVGVLINYALAVSEVGSGAGTVTSAPGPISCSEANGSITGTCSASYQSGSLVTLTANAAGTSTFLGWGGDCASAGTSPTCNVSMNLALNVSASFDQQSFGNVNVCPPGETPTPSCSSSLALTFNMAANTTIGVIRVVTQGISGLDFALGSGSTCNGTIAAGNSCTVNVNFTPLAPGLRMGAVQLFDNSANLLATTPIYGIGQGPAIAFGPGTQITVNTGSYSLSNPQGAAVDAAGDFFIADYGNSRVVKVPAGGGTSTLVSTGTYTLNGPFGLAVDGAGDLFIADYNNARVVQVPAGGAPAFVSTSPYTVSGPEGLAVDGAGDLFIASSSNGQVIEVPAGGGAPSLVNTGSITLAQPSSVAVDGVGGVFIADRTKNEVVQVPAGGTPALVNTGSYTLNSPQGVAVDAAGDILIADAGNNRVLEVTPEGSQSIVESMGTGQPYGITVDGTGDVFTASIVTNQVSELARFLPPSLSFALTNVDSTSADSPQLVSIQNAGNQPLTGSLALNLGTNFAANGSSTCGSGFSLAPGAMCSESFSFTPQTTGYLTGTAAFSDNTLNLSSLVVLQTVNLSGNGGLNGQAVGVAVPNVVGLTQAAATTAITGAGLALGTVSTAPNSIVPSGSVTASNPAAGAQVSVGSAVRLLVSTGQAPPQTPNPLSFENNYFVTGDYASAGVALRGTGVNGVATGTITIPDSSTTSGVSQGVPDGADIIDAFLYWETLENTPSPSATSGTFDNYPITGQQIGSDLPYTDGTLSGTLRVYRADVNAYFPVGANGVRFASGAFTVSLPDGGTALPLTEGASLVVIYRVLSPNFPLKAVVIYDGSAIPATSTTQNMQGFYDSAGTGENTALFDVPGGGWNNSSGPVALPVHANQFSAPLNAGNAYAAVILSTPVNNSENDGILDAWKAGPAAGDFYAGQPGYYDVKTGAWVPLPGAQHGEKDLFVQLDYMCGAVLSNGSCDPNQENLFPSPDAQGNDPLAMVTNAFAAIGVHLHLEIGNAVPEDTCTDNTSTTPPQLCQFPSQPGVIGWKNSLEFSKLWPRNLASCAGGGDCSPRFPYGQKDSYHYVLFGHSLAIPAWNSRYGSLTSIQVSSGVTTIVTTDRGNGINYCPSRITISGVLGNPSLNGVYNTTGCANSSTMTLSTPGVPNWSYPNTTLPEPVIGLTSGTVTSISGYSDLGGSDSAVTLGLWETAPNQNMSKRANVIAGTLFHEIGHTLGLSHGGLYYDGPSGSYIPTFDVNCKPNYQSVMNYLFQLDGVGPNAAVAFSNQQLDGEPLSGPPATVLSLNSLGSVAQLTDGSGNPATFSTSAWYTPNAPSSTASPATMHCDGTPLTGDTGYRVDGTVDPLSPSWSPDQNITFDGVPYTTLRGYNDVANIDLRQVGATGGEFASLASVLSFGSSTAPLNVAAGGTVSLGSGGTVTVGSGGTVTLGSGGTATVGSGSTITPGSGGSVTLNNGGTVTLPATGGTVTLGSGGTVTLGSGGTVTLGSGGTITLGSGGTIALGSGGTIALGSGGTITSSAGTVTIPSTGGTYTLPDSGGIIALGSGGTIALGSGGTVTLGSGGTIALGSGGTVALGSGGTIALGSGGTIALGSGGTIALGSGGTVTLGSGGTIALGSGGTIALGSGGTVTLGSGGTVTLGSGGDLSLGSGGTVALGSGGTVTLGSGGTVTLGSGGNVTLGSGGTIALGSGGTVALGSGGTVTLGSGGTIALGSGGTVTVPPGGSYTIDSSGGTITLGSGGTVTLGSGGTVALGSGGTITMGSGGTVTLGSGGTVTLGSGGVVALGSGGTIALGSGGTIALGSGGTVTLGSGGATTNELDYNTANSIVRPPSSPTETPISTSPGTPVVINWTAPTFGVVATYTISRGSEAYEPFVIGSVSGVNGNPPATTFTDTNPDLTSHTVVYTIGTTLLPVPIDPTQRQSPPSPPAVLTNNQTIVLGPPALPSSVSISTSPLTVYATAESNGVVNGLQVSFSAISATGSCSIASQSPPDSNGVSSATVALNSAGSCTITASQPGTDLSQPGTPPYYNAANSVSGTFTILPQGSNTQSQTINFPQLPNVQYGSTFSLSALSSAGLPVSFTASGPCTASGSTTGVGLCAITASAPAGTVGNNSYSAASVSQSFNIYPAVITVSANNLTSVYGQPLPSLTYTTSPLVNGDPSTAVTGAPVLSTTAATGSIPGSYPITVSTGTLAAANYSFLYVSGTLTIGPASQAITFTTNAPATAAYNSSFTVVATGGASGNPVIFTSSGACTNSGATYKMTSGTGTCSVIANQASSTNYSAAPQVTQTVTATLVAQTITFAAPASPVTYGVSPITLSATTTAGLTVAFSVDPTSTGIGTISGNTLTVKGAGNLVIDANQAGSSNYQAATQVQRTIVVSKATLTVTANNVSRAYGLANPALTASYGGFVNGDTAATAVTGSPSLTTTAVATSLPGSYPITVSQGNLAAANYTFNFVNGTLTVSYTGSVPTSGTACNGAYSGTFQGNLTVVGAQACVFVGGGTSGNITETGGNLVLNGATVGGSVSVSGGSLVLSGGTVGGNVTVSGSSTFSIGPSTTIKGNLQIQGIPSGSATNQVCATSISGNLQFQSNGTSVLIGSGTSSCAGNVVKGSLQVLSNTAAITIDGNTVGGTMQVQSNSAVITMDTNKVSAAMQVQSNSGATTVDGNSVGGTLQDQSNTGATQVFSNIITGALQCQSNTTITGGSNTAASKTGQCAKF